MFITTAEFLPRRRDPHHQVLQIISSARARGQERLAEMSRQVAGTWEKITTGWSRRLSPAPRKRQPHHH